MALTGLRRGLLLILLALAGGVLGFALTSVYLRWAWNRTMEEAP